MRWKQRPKKGTFILVFVICFFICIRCDQNDKVPQGAGSNEVVFKLLGSDETCVKCHIKTVGLAASHDPAVIGCASCHLGNPQAEDQDASHTGMELIPGNLNTINSTCGRIECHQDIADRLKGSLMTTMAGVINIDRFVFGESDTLTKFAHVNNLKDNSPADTHLRQLCASCHLGKEKTELGPISERSRGGGCLACHLQYEAVSHSTDTALDIHPALTIEVQPIHCFGCHSRSGRISTNYEGWHETTLDKDSFSMSEEYRLLDDGRIFTFIESDVHFQSGMDCIDCHNATELMGDGTIYLHKENAVKIECVDCHSQNFKKMVPYSDLDLESQKILGLRKIDLNGKKFLIGKSGSPYLNVSQKDSGEIQLTTKNRSIPLELKPPASICTQGAAHDRLTCSTCHTGWAPQCVGCHIAYNPEENGFDHIAKKPVQGKWEEYIGVFNATLPPLGLVEKISGSDTIRQITTFVHGMTMRLDQTNFPGNAKVESFHRLFAPISAHTITTVGRSCRSCHNDPTALGYGNGHLEYQVHEKEGKWQFFPAYVNEPEDGLPQDAWIGFLERSEPPNSTRPDARPFSVEEQKRILTVGACLVCHDENSSVMMLGINNFHEVNMRLSKSCVPPVWD